MYNLNVEIGSNPDRDRSPWEETHEISAPTIKELRAKVLAFIGEQDLGGGNWGEATLTKDGTHIGYMSYNGRVWQNHSSFNEVIVED